MKAGTEVDRSLRRAAGQLEGAPVHIGPIEPDPAERQGRLPLTVWPRRFEHADDLTVDRARSRPSPGFRLAVRSRAREPEELNGLVVADDAEIVKRNRAGVVGKDNRWILIERERLSVGQPTRQRVRSNAPRHLPR